VGALVGSRPRVDITELLEALKMAADEPATWTPAALAKHTGLSEADMAAILKYYALPVLPERMRRH
jgi:hypothetical protein